MGVHTYFEYFSVYLETARSTTASTLTFTIATGGTWKIKVSQIECSSTSRGYPDCDQFFTGISGQVASFNWPNVQLQSKDYTYCIRREQGTVNFRFKEVFGNRKIFLKAKIFLKSNIV